MLDISRQAGIAALEGVIGRSQGPLCRSAVGHHHDLLEGGTVAAHVIGGVVDDVVIPASCRERGAFGIHMAQLTVVGHSHKTHAVEVFVGTVAPQIALECIHTHGEEGRDDDVFDINALVV